VWEKAVQANQLGREFARLTYDAADADGLFVIEAADRTIRGARDLISVALQYGNAFGRGLSGGRTEARRFLGNDDVLYLMEDMATGEIRLSILWEWVHKGARLTAADAAAGAQEGDLFTPELCARLIAEEYESCKRRATATCTTTPSKRRCRSHARSSRPTSRSRSSCRGTWTC
jgi:malate synthase